MPDRTRACEQCGTRFMHVMRLPHPRTCGRLLCRALETWTPELWEGQRRMARARLVAGRRLIRTRNDDGGTTMAWVDTDPLNDLDRAALQREVA